MPILMKSRLPTIDAIRIVKAPPEADSSYMYPHGSVGGVIAAHYAVGNTCQFWTYMNYGTSHTRATVLDMDYVDELDWLRSVTVQVDNGPIYKLMSDLIAFNTPEVVKNRTCDLV